MNNISFNNFRFDGTFNAKKLWQVLSGFYTPKKVNYPTAEDANYQRAKSVNYPITKSVDYSSPKTINYPPAKKL